MKTVWWCWVQGLFSLLELPPFVPPAPPLWFWLEDDHPFVFDRGSERNYSSQMGESVNVNIWLGDVLLCEIWGYVPIGCPFKKVLTASNAESFLISELLINVFANAICWLVLLGRIILKSLVLWSCNFRFIRECPLERKISVRLALAKFSVSRYLVWH